MITTHPTRTTSATAGSERHALRMILALLVGAVVASPALADSARDASLVFTLVAAGVVAYLLQRSAPEHPRVAGSARFVAHAGAVVAVLALLSVSFGIVAADAAIWVLAPAVVAVVLTWMVSRAVD